MLEPAPIPSIPFSQLRKRNTDVEEPRYRMRVAAQVSGVDPKILNQWLFRGLLDVSQWDGSLIEKRKRRQAGNNPRRLYSALDVIKLAIAVLLVRGGIPVEIAGQAPAVIEGILGSEDLEALTCGEVLRGREEVPRRFALFRHEEGRLEVVWYYSLAFPYQVYESPLDALGASELGFGLLLDWATVVTGVLDELKAIEGRGAAGEEEEPMPVVEARCTASDVHVGRDFAGEHVLIAVTSPGSDQVETLKAVTPEIAEEIARQLLQEAAICRGRKG